MQYITENLEFRVLYAPIFKLLKYRWPLALRQQPTVLHAVHNSYVMIGGIPSTCSAFTMKIYTKAFTTPLHLHLSSSLAQSFLQSISQTQKHQQIHSSSIFIQSGLGRPGHRWKSFSEIKALMLYLSKQQHRTLACVSNTVPTQSNKGDYEDSEQQEVPPYMGITSGVLGLGTITVYSVVNIYLQ